MFPFLSSLERSLQTITSLILKTAQRGTCVMPTSQMRRLRLTERKEPAWGHSDPGAEPGLEARPPHVPLCLAVLETMLSARTGPDGPLCTIKPRTACIFSRKESENSWCHCAGTLWAWERLNHSFTDWARFSLCLMRSGHQRLQQGACPSSAHTSCSQVTAPLAVPDHLWWQFLGDK